MFEALCAVLAITVAGLAWHIWRAMLKWIGITAAGLAVAEAKLSRTELLYEAER
jgi:hypothetical protein